MRGRRPLAKVTMNRSLPEIVGLFIPPIFSRIAFVARSLFTTQVLEIAPGGWDTKLANTEESGWSSAGVVEDARKKWDAYCEHLEGSGPLGFSHEYR